MENKKIICEKCGVSISYDKKFCPNCGARLNLNNNISNVKIEYAKPIDKKKLFLVFGIVSSILLTVGCGASAPFIIANYDKNQILHSIEKRINYFNRPVISSDRQKLFFGHWYQQEIIINNFLLYNDLLDSQYSDYRIIKYSDDNDVIHFFKREPIEWDIIYDESNSNGRCIRAISSKVFDTTQYLQLPEEDKYLEFINTTDYYYTFNIPSIDELLLLDNFAADFTDFKQIEFAYCNNYLAYERRYYDSGENIESYIAYITVNDEGDISDIVRRNYVYGFRPLIEICF